MFVELSALRPLRWWAAAPRRRPSGRCLGRRSAGAVRQLPSRRSSRRFGTGAGAMIASSFELPSSPPSALPVAPVVRFADRSVAGARRLAGVTLPVRLFEKRTVREARPRDESSTISRTDADGKLDRVLRGPTRASSSFVARAVKTVGPAVVRIDTERVVQLQSDPAMDEPIFRYFFGDDLLRQLPKERTELGQGSAFFITEDGLLLTNAHVVAKASKVTVTLTDGRTYAGQVVGTDDLLDLAVVRIDAKGEKLPTAPLGSSSELQVGDWVIAVGNPVGLDNTVTLGIVSSVNRSSAEVGIPDKRINFIQTDAAINPGNSGGPLLNEFGEVVGISTAIRPNAEGIGFAIPIDRAKAIMHALARGEKVKHPFVGIQMITVTPELAKQNNDDPNALALIPEVAGVLVLKVAPKTPAAEAGIRRFDVITTVDGRATTNAKEIQAIVDAAQVGQKLKFQVLRGADAKPVELSVKAGDMTQFRAEQEKKSSQEKTGEGEPPSTPSTPPHFMPHPRQRRLPLP
eukprot:ctg_504.g296